MRRLLGRLRRHPSVPVSGFDPALLGPADAAIVERAEPHTMTGAARICALIDAVRYCVAAELPGAFAECGVWRGGSVLAMVLTLQDLGVDDREIFLFDTFEGMTRPGELDTTRFGGSALRHWDERTERMTSEFESQAFDPRWFHERGVRELLSATGYEEGLLHFVRGRVEETIPERAPDGLALLRLDTDWYQSTRHELVHLYPRLCEHGVLIIDDYGHWDGARRAVDEYFAGEVPAPLLNRIDYSGRIAVKRRGAG